MNFLKELTLRALESVHCTPDLHKPPYAHSKCLYPRSIHPKMEGNKKNDLSKCMLWQQSKYGNSSAVHQSEKELNNVSQTYANQQYTMRCCLKLNVEWSWRDDSEVETLAALAENPRLVGAFPSARMAAHSHLNSHSRGSNPPLVSTGTAHGTQMCMQAKQPHT